MNDALNEMISRMIRNELQRARLSSERAKNDELFAIL